MRTDVLNVDLGDRSYPIYIGSGLLGNPELLRRHLATLAKLSRSGDGLIKKRLDLVDAENVLHRRRKRSHFGQGLLTKRAA